MGRLFDVLEFGVELVDLFLEQRGLLLMLVGY